MKTSRHSPLHLLIALFLAAPALLVGAGSAPAQAADERPCVSQREYDDVLVGWRHRRVADHFDFSGRPIGYEQNDYEVDSEWVYRTDSVWIYRKCSAWGPRGSYVGVAYSDHDNGYTDPAMRVTAKVATRPQQLLSHMFAFTSTVEPDGGGPCVTRREFRDVRILRWSPTRVRNHFDSPGELMQVWGSFGEVDVVYRYRKCSTWGPGGKYVGVAYSNYNGEQGWSAVSKDANLTWSDIGIGR